MSIAVPISCSLSMHFSASNPNFSALPHGRCESGPHENTKAHIKKLRLTMIILYSLPANQYAHSVDSKAPMLITNAADVDAAP